MPQPATVAIVIPVFNDEAWIAAALESCRRQSLAEIEIICVDDASTDDSRSIIGRYQQLDPRIRLIEQQHNLSAFQARRAGIQAATAPYVLFLDGDDELNPNAAELAVAKATSADADLVGFGVEVLLEDGRTVGGYQSRLAPVRQTLEGAAVLAGLFPAGKAAHGQLWRYLFRTELLRDAYACLPEDLVLKRVNDLPIAFLAAARARRYVGIPERLYRYYFRRGGSGHRVEDVSRFAFYLGAIDSVDAIEQAVHTLAEASPEPQQLLDSYQTARRSIVGNVLGYLVNNVGGELHAQCLALLVDRVPEAELVMAAAEYCEDAIAVLAQHGRRIEAGERDVRSVLLTTKTLRNGGVSGVLVSQARFLLDAGYRVVIAATLRGSNLDDLPDGAEFVEVTGNKLATRLSAWMDLCRTRSIDVVIDHQILYSRRWPAYAVAARAVGVPTIGWVHNFALRPTYDSNDLLSFLKRHLNAVATLVTLSPLDVAFWKLRGVGHTVHLPNPPSPMLLESAATSSARTAPEGRLELIWWGRLEQHTKQVLQLVEVADQLRRLAVDFRLTIIGPDWSDLTAAQLTATVKQRGLDQHVAVPGPKRGQELLDAIDAADLFVTTSIIEGYQLTLAEAQARGLPVVMYDLSWLVLVQDNDGVVTVPQGDAVAMASEIVRLGEDAERYARLSAASIESAQRAKSLDFSALYQQLIGGELPAEFSPEPALDDARQIIEWMVFFSEHSRNAESVARSQAVPGGANGSLARRIERRLRGVARRVVGAVPALRPAVRRLQRTLSK